MKIRKVALGNKEEAYVEENLCDALNIISSDDNNKGKTIVVQSIMYALGCEPAFPTSFNYKKYYYYIEFENAETIYKLCRIGSSFVLKHESSLMVFDSVSELKRYWTKHIFRLPQIIKNQVSKIVDPVLFFQLCFIGQDTKDSSTIAHAGLYNKQDFYDMLYDFCNISGLELDEQEISHIKSEIAKLKDDRNILLKQHRILSSKKLPVSYISSTNDKVTFQAKIASMEKLNSKIAELRKDRNVIATRRATWETTLKELRSLNRTIDCGELRCMDCKSTNISFTTSKKHSYAFSVSSVDMRNEIITSIAEKIDTYNEEIEKIAVQIAEVQQELQSLMADESISLESIVAYKQQIFSATDAEEKIKEIDAQLNVLNSQLVASSDISQEKKIKQIALINALIEKMNIAYRNIDPLGNLSFDDLFTTRGELYSGSEATMFHIAKLYALREVLNHNLPIIMDSFRAEDLSSAKEDVVIELYKPFSNQIIFTTTLKDEELGKYNNVSGVHHIDYSGHTPSKILSAEYVKLFSEMVASLSLQL